MSQIFGILNITPDSFSDGGENFNPETAIQKAKQMINDGVFAIDVGAESTRPNAIPIDSEEEISRLSLVLPKIAELNTIVSLDTRNYETAKWGLSNGVKIINDVSGFRDERMIELVAKQKAIAVFMHSISVPPKADEVLVGENILEQLLDFAHLKINQFKRYKVPKTRLIFDVGIGFGKTPEQAIFLMKNIEYFKQLGVKLLVGHSRKSFLKMAFPEAFEGRAPSVAEKDTMTAVFSGMMWSKVDFLRLHNVINILRLLK